MELAGLYTPLPIALVELKRRRRDAKLVKKVRDYFAGFPPLEELKLQPKAVMARALITANLELEHFLNTSKDLSLDPIFYEFRNDKFAHINPEKRALGHMVFYATNAQGERVITGSKRVVNFNTYQGKTLDKVQTLWGEDLVAFHHRLVTSHFPNHKLDIVDFSDWFRKARKFSTAYPYLRYLGLFLVHGILFENFTNRDDEQPFNEQVVIPAVNKLVEIFGVPPIIVPIEPLEIDDQPHWYSYDEKILKQAGPQPVL